jgi:hypothetical protein
MDHFEAPRAETALLIYLAFIIAIMGLFAGTLYWLAQPTILPNRGYTDYKPPVQAFSFHDASTTSEDMERVALATAEHENAEQGIDALRAFARAGRVSVAERRPAPNEINAAPNIPKKKRVAKARRPLPITADAWQPPWAHGRTHRSQARQAQAYPPRQQGLFFFFQ